MITCGRCGVMNPAGATMCGACYAPIVYAAPGTGAGAGPSATPPGGGSPPGAPPIYQYPPQYQGAYGEPAMQTRTSRMAIAGFVLSFFCSLLGLIFSIIGYNECKNSGGAVTGEGLALAGIIISIVSLVLGIMLVMAGNSIH